MSRAPPWLLLVLGVSLTFNLVGLGWLLGRVTTGQPFPEPVTHRFDFEFEDDRIVTAMGPDGETPTQDNGVSGDISKATLRRSIRLAPESPHDLGSGLRWMVATLPPERRDRIEVELEVRGEPLLGDAAEVVVLRDVVREELARTRFEKSRLEEALARLREQVLEIQADSHRILADVAAELTEEERAALAASLASSVVDREFIFDDGGRSEVHVYTRRILMEDGAIEDSPPDPE